MTLFRQDGLWVELHTFNGKFFMFNAHDFIDIAIIIIGPRGDFKTIWQTGLIRYQ